jgi:hypothetical protein
MRLSIDPNLYSIDQFVGLTIYSADPVSEGLVTEISTDKVQNCFEPCYSHENTRTQIKFRNNKTHFFKMHCTVIPTHNPNTGKKCSQIMGTIIDSYSGGLGFEPYKITEVLLVSPLTVSVA